MEDKPFSSTGRMAKYLKELAGSLKDQEKRKMIDKMQDIHKK